MIRSFMLCSLQCFKLKFYSGEVFETALKDDIQCLEQDGMPVEKNADPKSDAIQPRSQT